MCNHLALLFAPHQLSISYSIFGVRFKTTRSSGLNAVVIIMASYPTLCRSTSRSGQLAFCPGRYKKNALPATRYPSMCKRLYPAAHYPQIHLTPCSSMSLRPTCNGGGGGGRALIPRPSLICSGAAQPAAIGVVCR